MDKLTKIRYNCRKATFLIEKKQIGSITLRERLELKIHLAGCSICRTFEQQSRMINQLVKDLLKGAAHQEMRLDDEFKNKLQNRIDEELNKG